MENILWPRFRLSDHSDRLIQKLQVKKAVQLRQGTFYALVCTGSWKSSHPLSWQVLDWRVWLNGRFQKLFKKNFVIIRQIRVLPLLSWIAGAADVEAASQKTPGKRCENPVTHFAPSLSNRRNCHWSHLGWCHGANHLGRWSSCTMAKTLAVYTHVKQQMCACTFKICHSLYITCNNMLSNRYAWFPIHMSCQIIMHSKTHQCITTYGIITYRIPPRNFQHHQWHHSSRQVGLRRKDLIQSQTNSAICNHLTPILRV